MKPNKLLLALPLFYSASFAQNRWYGLDPLTPITTVSESGTVNNLIALLPVNIYSDGNTVTYLICDHIQSARVLLTNSNELSAAYTYTPYGIPAGANTDLLHNIGSYAGTYNWDKQTGIYTTPTRKYDPHTGNFLSIDPKGTVADAYKFTENNPVNLYDQDGQAPTTPPMLAALASDRVWDLYEQTFSRLSPSARARESGIVATVQSGFYNAIQNDKMIRQIAAMMTMNNAQGDAVGGTTPIVLQKNFESITDEMLISAHPVVRAMGLLEISPNSPENLIPHTIFRGNPPKEYLWKIRNPEDFTHTMKVLAALAMQGPGYSLPNRHFTDLAAIHLSYKRIRANTLVFGQHLRDHPDAVFSQIGNIEIFRHEPTNRQVIWLNRDISFRENLIVVPHSGRIYTPESIQSDPEFGSSPFTRRQPGGIGPDELSDASGKLLWTRTFSY